MMFMPSMLLFVLILLLSLFMVISSPSWLGAWVGLELNLMSFIPMILSRGVVTSVESCIKYFLVQAFSSLLLILSLLEMSSGGSMDWFLHLSSSYILIVSLLIKLGAAPFHFWFPAVASGIGWMQNFVLMTLQKIGPLVVLSYVWGASSSVMLLVAVSAYVGSVGGLNQSSLRKLMAYSSINHLGWLMVASYFGLKFMMIYFLIYVGTNLGLVSGLMSSGLYYLSQVYYYSGTKFLTLVILINWLSFGGLPPFIGFFAKWLVINLMVDSGMVILCAFMVLMSLISLYYYTRVCYIILSQSSVSNLVSSVGQSGTWELNFSVLILVISLVLAPMFVMWF